MTNIVERLRHDREASADEIARVMWDSDHDGSWDNWGDGQDESRNIYLANAEVVLAKFAVRLRDAQLEGI